MTSSNIVDQPQSGSPEVRIAVMGGSGTGKSTFVNCASGSQFRIGEGLESCTERIELSHPFNVDGRNVRLVDTPGFDDSSKSDADILKLLADFLVSEYRSGRMLSGVLFLHRISDVRMGSVAKRNFNMFRKLCGTDALNNVVIVTTRWDQVDPKVGAARQEELGTKSNLYGSVLDAGGVMMRYNHDHNSALVILRRLIGRAPKPLLLQIEMAQNKTHVSDTEAGLELRKGIMKEAEKQKEEMRALLEEMVVAQGHDREQEELEKECLALRAKMMLLQEEAGKLSGSQCLGELTAQTSRVDVPNTDIGRLDHEERTSAIHSPSVDNSRGVATPVSLSEDEGCQTQPRTRVDQDGNDLQGVSENWRRQLGGLQRDLVNLSQKYRETLHWTRDGGLVRFLTNWIHALADFSLTTVNALGRVSKQNGNL